MLQSDWFATRQILAHICRVEKVNKMAATDLSISVKMKFKFSFENSTQKYTQKAIKFGTKVFDGKLNG